MTCHHITVGDFSILTSYHSGRCFYFDFHFEEALTNYYSAHSGHVLLGRGSLKIVTYTGLTLLSIFVNSNGHFKLVLLIIF